MTRQAFRGSFLDFVGDPFFEEDVNSVRYFPDGLMIVEAGIIQALGSYEVLHPQYPDIPVTEYIGKLILPGFVDTHIHFPQTEMIAAYGEQLLAWLHKYTFPTEAKFKDKDYAQRVASFFLEELLKNGTTTALVFTAVYPEAAEAFFEEAERRNLRMIAGKVMMDRHAPDHLIDTAESSYADSKRLIQKWHQRGRLRYAVTPRFAVTSTPEQLKLAAKLLQEFPDVHLHTHLAENVDEVRLVAEMFPESKHYLDVYDQAGLVGDRSVFAHGVQLSDEEFARLSQAGAAIAFCPTSNLFLGSGLFRIEQAKSVERPVKLGLGTDVGAGTSFSMLQTCNEAYKIGKLRRQKLSAFQALFLATLGGAQALRLDHYIGNFEAGKEADFVVLDPRCTPLLAFRNAKPADTLAAIAEQAFTLMMLGDDRAVHATYIMGNRYAPDAKC
ncbi:MAG TPA: guanine deaminase [Synechococcales cyanobacterium M55_K2018_004]|nr:guanine deaminase [Synechococcales cyanobacterium M55_K2018_004]